jgi:NADH-quinone oxidoreductase subunit J
MVLFLFVIMLLDLGEEERRRIHRLALVAGLLVVGAMGALLLGSLRNVVPVAGPAPSLEANAAEVGRLLFTQYLLPFEILSVLLLVAMVGVVLLARREAR